MGCRRNLARLSPVERTAFVNAVRQLDADGGYLKYVRMHEGAMGHGHGGPAFFPWHREYLRRFELDLQTIDPDVTIPYWDWTVSNLNAAGTESLIWRDDFMGGPGNGGAGFAVDTGPFTDWGLRRNAFDIFSFPGTGGTITTYKASLRYDTFRRIEGPHGGAHVWVGGTVRNPVIAPEDPVFWLIHSNVDRLWAEWTVEHRGAEGWVEYEPESGARQGHNLNDPMWPWNGSTDPFGVLPWTTTPVQVRPADLLDHRAINTRYDTIDLCLTIDPTIFGPGADIDIGDLIEFPETKRWIKDLIEIPTGEHQPKSWLKDRKEMVETIDPWIKARPAEDDPDIREPFIRQGLRPDLTRSALGFESDISALRAELRRRERDLGSAGRS